MNEYFSGEKLFGDDFTTEQISAWYEDERLALDGLFNRKFPVWVDAMLCKVFSWNIHYHPRTLIQRFCPHTIFLIVTKDHDSA